MSNADLIVFYLDAATVDLNAGSIFYDGNIINVNQPYSDDSIIC